MAAQPSFPRPYARPVDEAQGFLFGDYRHRADDSFGPVHGFVMSLVILRSGQATIEADGEPRALRGGDAAVILSRRRVHYRFTGAPETHIAWCETLDPSGMRDAVATVRRLPPSLRPSRRLRALMRIGLQIERGASLSYAAMRNALARTLFYEFFYQAQLFAEHAPLPTPLLRARSFIEDHFQERLRLSTVAREVGMTPQHLHRLFQHYLHCTPGDYLWTLRAERALHLLHQTGMSVAEIAYEVGFQSADHFSRFMKQRHGHPPTVLRRRRWSGTGG